MEDLNKAVDLTSKNLDGMAKFFLDLKGKVDAAETDAQKTHLVSFCQAINDVVSALLHYNNSLSGKDNDSKRSN